MEDFGFTLDDFQTIPLRFLNNFAVGGNHWDLSFRVNKALTDYQRKSAVGGKILFTHFRLIVVQMRILAISL